MLQPITTSFLAHLSLNLFILALLVPFSFQRSLPSSPQWNENKVLNQSIEIPIFSAGKASSKVLLVPIQLGEPPQTLYLIPDTGSDATWVYCDRLPYRHNNNFSNHIFSHSRSSTFAPIYCSSPVCTGINHCSSSTRDLCNYAHEYVDGTATTGYWATDTVTIKSDKRRLDLKFHGMMFGCSSQDFINLNDADGILGLSPNHPSFTSHLAPRFGYMFSYFLASNKGVSNKNLLVFGRTERSGISFEPEQMQYTKFIQTNSFFHVEVSGLSFDDVLLDIPKWVWKFDAQNESSGVILDTGTTFTYVPGVAFQAIHALYAEFFKPYSNVTVTSSDVCFNSLAPEFDGIQMPRMAFEFEDGARFVPHEENLFYEDEDGSSCLAIRAIDQSDGSIIGSNLQTGYFWEYDLLNQRVGFACLV
uniref:Aspartic proteinase NANA, chloroplast-like n=1 Tax=Elaeis guineensis var. tenera TaxID=51953 RepID=A0A6I9R2W5_ELAGV|nr:aspartic proteinase NANA, chloroplast-like [Elaeis guineensis]